MLPLRHASRVLRRERSGSSLPVVVETDGPPLFVKLRGSAQGITALVAEMIVASLAQQLGLAVPARALVELPAAVDSDDQNDELRDLLNASVGLNLGFELLEGARNLTKAEYETVPLDVAASVLWLDTFTQNLDRSPANPNVMVRRNTYWLIDHGAALPFQHDWSRVTEQSPSRPYDRSRHVFSWASPVLSDVHTQLAPRLTRDAITAAVAEVPDDFVRALDEDVSRRRAMYEAYLWKRAHAMEQLARAE